MELELLVRQGGVGEVVLGECVITAENERLTGGELERVIEKAS